MLIEYYEITVYTGNYHCIKGTAFSCATSHVVVSQEVDMLYKLIRFALLLSCVFVLVKSQVIPNATLTALVVSYHNINALMLLG